MTEEEVRDFIVGLLDQSFPVVHVLRGGFPLCGFSLHLPENWPVGNTWVSFRDPEVRMRVTCTDCKDELEEVS